MRPFETVGRRLRGVHSSWGAVDGAALLLRGVLGFVFVAHGAQKLFGWFGGAGTDGTAFNGANGFFSSDGGWELNLALIGLLGGLGLLGAGAWSLDRALGLARHDEATVAAPGGARFSRSARELDELIRR